jgi:hypothetical protein
MIRSAVEALVVLCAVIGFYALLSILGLFPQATMPLVLAVIGCFVCYLYGRHGRRWFGSTAL